MSERDLADTIGHDVGTCSLRKRNHSAHHLSLVPNPCGQAPLGGFLSTVHQRYNTAMAPVLVMAFLEHLARLFASSSAVRHRTPISVVA